MKVSVRKERTPDCCAVWACRTSLYSGLAIVRLFCWRVPRTPYQGKALLLLHLRHLEFRPLNWNCHRLTLKSLPRNLFQDQEFLVCAFPHVHG